MRRFISSSAFSVLLFVLFSAWLPTSRQELQAASAPSRAAAARLLEQSRELKAATKRFVITLGPPAEYRGYLPQFVERERQYERALFRPIMKAGYVDTNGADDSTYPLPKATGDDFACSPPVQKQRSCTIIVARAGQVEVSGISENQRGADVEFNWKWVLTQVGTELRTAGLDFALRSPAGTPLVLFDLTERHNASAHLKQWDDGWRVENLTLDKF